MDKKIIAHSLLSVGAVVLTPQRPVRFKSGIASPVYVDNRKLPFHPTIWEQVVGGFKAKVVEKKEQPEVIAGVAVGGIPYSAVVGYVLKMPSVFVRKEAKGHGTQQLVEGGDVQGKHVLLIEDLITTGGSSIKAATELRRAGAVISHMLAVVQYGFPEAQEAFAQHRLEVDTLTDFQTILEVATNNKQISEDEKHLLEDWFADPKGWEKRQHIHPLS